MQMIASQNKEIKKCNSHVWFMLLPWFEQRSIVVIQADHSKVLMATSENTVLLQCLFLE